MPRVIRDSGKPLDHPGDSRQRPQVCPEAMTLRTKTHRGIYHGQLLCIESGLASGSPRSLELLDAPIQKAQKPSANTLPADVQFIGNLSLLPAGFEQSRCSKTSPFHPTEVPPGSKNFRLLLHAIAFYYKMKCLSLLFCHYIIRDSVIPPECFALAWEKSITRYHVCIVI